MSSIRGEKRIDLRGSTIVKLEKNNKRFEILVDPNSAWEYKKGKDVDIRDILIGFFIFTDAKKGEKAGEEILKENFGTDDIFAIAKKILDEGELQLTTELRRKLVDEKLKQIVHIISRNGINPKTGQPHPPDRIRKAIEQARVSIDPFKPTDALVKEVIEALRPILLIRIETLILEVVIPPLYTGKAYGVVKQFGNVTDEEWQTNGAWKAVLEMPAGLYSTFMDRINKLTLGKAMIKVIERK